MKNQFILSFLFLALGVMITGCGEKSENTDYEESDANDVRDPVIVKDEIDKRFQKCYFEEDYARKKCDSVLISKFGKTIFNQNIRLDLSHSFLNCDSDDGIELVPFGDSSCCAPNSFDLLYQIRQNGNKLYSFRMVAREEMAFEPVSTIVGDQFLGYKKLLEGKLTITYAKAKRIAIANGADLKETELELLKTESDDAGKSAYHWEAELDVKENSMHILYIDAMSGKTSKQELILTSIQ